jgi:hypothetical protein
VIFRAQIFQLWAAWAFDMAGRQSVLGLSFWPRDAVVAPGARDGLRVPEAVTRFDPGSAPPQQADLTWVLAARGRAL